MDSGEREALGRLVCGRRWAALATCRDGAPLASMVAYAVLPGFSGFLMLLSRLARHTANLLSDPRAALAISEPDAEGRNPQTLARVTIEGEVHPIDPGDPGYGAARACYLDRLPASAPLFDFGDFALYRLVPREARFVAGFARAYTLTAAELAGAAPGGAPPPRRGG